MVGVHALLCWGPGSVSGAVGGGAGPPHLNSLYYKMFLHFTPRSSLFTLVRGVGGFCYKSIDPRLGYGKSPEAIGGFCYKIIDPRLGRGESPEGICVFCVN